jgi:hypothetical protein
MDLSHAYPIHAPTGPIPRSTAASGAGTSLLHCVGMRFPLTFGANSR